MLQPGVSSYSFGEARGIAWVPVQPELFYPKNQLFMRLIQQLNSIAIIVAGSYKSPKLSTLLLIHLTCVNIFAYYCRKCLGKRY